MILTCPACSTRYLTDAGSFAAPGRTVRCAKCGHSWFQNAPGVSAEDSGHVPAAQTGYAASAAIPGVVKPPRPIPREAVMRPARRGSGVPVFIFILLGFFALLAALYQYRSQVAVAVPEAKSVYETLGIAVGGRHLEFRNVDFRWADPETRSRLEVWGEVVNTGKAAQTIPLIRFSMRDKDGLELYARTLTLPQRHLAPGASNSFSIALENPPENAADITVDFAAPDRS